MILTDKQQRGLEIAVARYSNHDPYTVISGYAGSGKSTLVSHIISALNVRREDVAYVAYTGKAAQVLKEKNCPNATTAHRLLYKSYPRNDGTFYHKPKRPLDYPYKIIVVDEVSMLPKDMWDLLLSHHVYVLALGDPGQLPPVKSESNGVLDNPHIFLDEIMRQAQESEIIRLSMDIREGKPLTPFKGKEVQVLTQQEFHSSMLYWADIVLVGKNETRQKINFAMRKHLLGATSNAPVEGDKIICCRNHWEEPSEFGDVMVNGMIGTLHNPQISFGVPFINTALNADFLPEEYGEDWDMSPIGAAFYNLNMDYQKFITGEPFLNKDNFRKFKGLGLKEFDYAYAITTHKAQGSEYKKVLVLEEYLRGTDHSRWLYTAATRASEKLVIVKDWRM